MTISDLFNQSPAERNAAMRAIGHPTHIGRPVGWAMEGYRLEMRHQARRKPTHRGEPRDA